jgi:hypothetical protein
MAEEIHSYLEEVRSHLHLDPRKEGRVISELETHFQEKVLELEREGIGEEEASRQALASFGEARSIARLMYEAYSSGSWVEVFLSCQPHFIVAALFATHFWHSPFMLAAALAAITFITILGWNSGSPIWMYSWAGYAFFPLLIIAFIARHPVGKTVSYLFSGGTEPAPVWVLAALALYYAFVVWLLVWAAMRVAKRDWLFVSLMLLPLPVLAIWALTIEQFGDTLFRFGGGIAEPVLHWDTLMAYFCVILGITSVLFVRLRQRILKVAAIVVVGMVSGALVIRSIWTDVGIGRLLAISLCLFFVLVSPLILRAFFGHEVSPKET